MLDDFFARDVLKDYQAKCKEANKELKLSDDETHAVITTLSKGNSEFLPLLLNNIEDGENEASKAKALFLALVAIENVCLSGFSKKKAIAELKKMNSSYGKNTLKEVMTLNK